MPAYARRERIVRPRERAYALAAVVAVQAGLFLALVRGLDVDLSHPSEAAQRLIDIALPKPPSPPPPPSTQASSRTRRHAAAAPKASLPKPGGSPGPRAHASPSVTPMVALKPAAAPSGGGAGSGPAAGSGSGGGKGGEGNGEDGGGTDLEQIAGEITSSDYPRDLREAGVGGRVSFVFKVEPNGRVGSCRITRSSGAAELDALTCRLIQQRFVYRPSTDRYGRPIEDEVEGDHDWISRPR